MSGPLCYRCERVPNSGLRRGMCSTCYHHVRTTEGFASKSVRSITSPEDRLLSKVTPGPGGCWIFTGATTRGYGSIQGADGKTQRAHRLAYEIFIGPVPPGLHIDHLCRVRRCVNPAHLEAVPQRVNTLRGVSFSAENAVKTHCVNGHEFTPENTYHRSPTHRQCRTCNNTQVAAYKERRRKSSADESA